MKADAEANRVKERLSGATDDETMDLLRELQRAQPPKPNSAA